MENNLMEKRKLARGIHSWHLTLIALGGIIGSGYFLGSGYIFANVGPGVIFSYIIAGFIVYSFMMSFGELLVNIPRRGSYVSYAREFYGGSFATGVGWAYWSSWTAYIPAEALGFGIIMNNFIPWNQFYWGIVCLVIITVLNLFQVELFANVQSILSLIKIFAVILFSVAAVGIIFGLIGGHAIGTSVIFNPDNGISLAQQIFPFGGIVIFTTMVMVICNYSGTEIVGIAAAEAQNPELTVPKACKSVTYRIMGIYILPIILLALIIPYSEAGLEDVVFSTALAKYGLNWAAVLFSFIILTAAFSCASSGVYSTSRTLYSLSVEGLAPKCFMRLNKYNVPHISTVFTIVVAWLIMSLGYFMPSSSFYAWLLGMTGFTATMPWLAIFLSQLKLRYLLKQRGYDISTLKVKVPAYPFLQVIGIILLIGSLFFMAFQPDLRSAFFMALACIIIPVTIYKISSKRGKIRAFEPDEEETTFDELFPQNH